MKFSLNQHRTVVVGVDYGTAREADLLSVFNLPDADNVEFKYAKFRSECCDIHNELHDESASKVMLEFDLQFSCDSFREEGGAIAVVTIRAYRQSTGEVTPKMNMAVHSSKSATCCSQWG